MTYSRTGTSLLFAVLGVVVVAAAARVRNTSSAEETSARAQERMRGAPADEFRPGHAPVDAFHPDRRPRADGAIAPQPKPAYGGRVIIHTEALPKSLNYVIENTAYERRVLYEVHETLLEQDWETHEWKPNLAERFEIDREADGGVSYTFFLRDGVKWHDGHAFDARDVVFSASLYANELIPSGEKRYQYQKIDRIELVDRLTVRFHYPKPYAIATQSLGDILCILPSHLYDLSDPDNAKHDAAYHAKKKSADPSWKPSAAEQADYVVSNPHNTKWVGLGPYRVVKWDAEMLEAARFDDYFDEARAGYVDTIRWRCIRDDAVAFQALLNGELDFSPRMSTDDYFGAATEKPQFTDSFYKGYYYTTLYWYVGWNLRRPQLADVAVRQALVRLFDFDAFRNGFYKGLALQVTGAWSPYAEGYDHALRPIPYEPERALEMLSAAGWEDKDGDGLRDKDGVPFEIEILVQAGSPVGRQFALKYQEDLARAGIRLKLTELDFGTILERRKKQDFDAIALGWVPPLDSDPEQLWHSKQAERADTSNFIGFADAECDALIEASQLELDPAPRAAIMRKLQARIYALQPYMFMYNPPRKFALRKSIRGFQAVHMDPNYVIRRWYYAAGTPGTRPERAGSTR